MKGEIQRIPTRSRGPEILVSLARTPGTKVLGLKIGHLLAGIRLHGIRLFPRETGVLAREPSNHLDGGYSLLNRLVRTLESLKLLRFPHKSPLTRPQKVKREIQRISTRSPSRGILDLISQHAQNDGF